MEIDIVGEDLVTQAIVERLIKEYRKDIRIKNRLPVRGGQLKANTPKYNLLNTPLFLLTDLDAFDCAPSLIKDWFNHTPVSNNFLFRVACEEAESWLMADREGFARWLNINSDLIPLKKQVDRKKEIYEIIFPIKPSLYLMMNIAPKSSKSSITDGLTLKAGAKKGPAYNSTILPFIDKVWNIENAAQNSYSLKKTIERLKTFKP